MPIVAFETTVPPNVAGVPACAIDLGFSESESSVGIAFHSVCGVSNAELPFGECVGKLNRWFRECGPECILIIEAPLTMALTAHGNPCHRQVELQRNYERGHAPRSPKGWYYQAGANLSLGSSILLGRLDVPGDVTVRLIEGFYCSIAADESRVSHRNVAAALLTQLHSLAGRPLVQPRAEIEGGVVLRLPGLEQVVQGIPPILLRDGLKIRESLSDTQGNI